ncbi:hypothetical protein [Thiomonas sp.]
MTTTTAQRAQQIIDSLENKKAGHNWLALCKSSTAFVKTWRLGRAGRRLAFLASQAKKTEAKGAARGYVVARHALLALEKMARKVKSMGGQSIATFVHSVFVLGIWATRAVAGVIDLPVQRCAKQNRAQTEFQLPAFFA